MLMLSFKGINDCGDNSDEYGCSNVNANSSTTEEPTMEPSDKGCSRNEFMCDSGLCISKPHLCDGISDCPNGDDEKYCPQNKCGIDSFR